jgi:transcriptional regulator with XRE-family HTH domain
MISILTVEQVKAARALLCWTQDDLANYANLTSDQIRSFESGRSRPTNVIDAIFNCCQYYGLEFVSGGVIRKQIASYILKDYIEVLDDVCKTLPEGGEIYKHCIDEKTTSLEIRTKIQKMRESGWIDYMTICEYDSFITTDAKYYRQIPDEYYSLAEMVLIYGIKVAFFTNEGVLVVESSDISRLFRSQFKYWWDKGVSP